MPMSKQQGNELVAELGDYITRSAHSETTRQMHLCGTEAVAALEDKLARHYGMKHALCVSSATTGLLALALALDLKQCVFVTTPYTWGGSLASWLMLGNRPTFADIEPCSLTLDPVAVDKVITEKTKALLAVDVVGHPSDTAALRQIADRHGLWYIADGAQSLGAHRDGLPASHLADAVVTSFTTGKSVFAGEGGAIITNNTELYQKLIWHTQHPYRQQRELGLHLWNEFALNARIHPLAAVWANATFKTSLQSLKAWQEECFALIEVLNRSSLTAPIEFEQQSVAPSFFRLTAAWKGRPQEARLLETLKQHNSRVAIVPSPVTLLYEQASFLAQYRRRFCLPFPCVNAARQAARRFCLVPRRN